MLKVSAVGALSVFAESLNADDVVPSEHGIPRVDYHVHIGDEISVAQAIKVSQERGIKFGLLQHAGARGHGYAVSNDEELMAWIGSLQGKAVFKGIEAEGTDWRSAFSTTVLAQADYIQSDPLGMPDETGAPMQLWRPDFRCDDPQKFMDRYVDFHVQLISAEPIDILAVPTFLPDNLRANYAQLWTEARMQKVIDAAVKFNVALEMDSRFRVPSLRFLQIAKAAGVKFSFGSNYQTTQGIGDIQYGVNMYKQLGLTLNRFFHPAAATKKPVLVRR